MNAHLNSLEKWLNELNVKNIARPTCLMVNRQSLLHLVGHEDDVIGTLKEFNIKLFISDEDAEWYYIDSF